MLDLLWWLIMLIAPPFALIMLLLNLKKRISSNGKRKWAFFHPFWYILSDKVMTEVVEKKCCGVS